MKPLLTFSEMTYERIPKIKESSVPYLGNMINVQNKEKHKNNLSEDEGLFIGYGEIKGCYPYKEQNQYMGELEEGPVAVAILENDFLKATFLTEYGGRLWQLIDKKTGRDLLYTNDVIRPRNLAIRNAWISGGVEWNIGAIGHSPFTCEKLYVAESIENGVPILRMYEYERIRQVTYQMDFWLEENADMLYCRMRIDNRNDDMVPMYWWSNIAVPECENGRIIVPAEYAYKNSSDHNVRKVKTPVDPELNKDISFYENTEAPVDYFFDIADTQKKYIAHVDGVGQGLLQLSSSRLRGRKLFSWGHLSGSDNWQNILTRNGGKYIEIQAGLAKTQYECIPMPPHTAWEWIECYTGISLEAEKVQGDYEKAVEIVDAVVEDIWKSKDLDQMVKETKETIGKKAFNLCSKGSGFGFLANMMRQKNGEALISEHLAFSSKDTKVAEWIHLLEKGFFMDKEISEVPSSFVCEKRWINELEKSVKDKGKHNWYTWYQLGIIYIHQGLYEKGIDCMRQSLFKEVNPWSYHGLAYAYANRMEINEAQEYALKAIAIGKDDYSLCESCMKLMLDHKVYTGIKKAYDQLTPALKENGRLKMYMGFAYVHLGQIDEAIGILKDQGGLKVDDIREGEVSLTELWMRIYQAMHPSVKEEDILVPIEYDFRMNA